MIKVLLYRRQSHLQGKRKGLLQLIIFTVQLPKKIKNRKVLHVWTIQPDQNTRLLSITSLIRAAICAGSSIRTGPEQRPGSPIACNPIRGHETLTFDTTCDTSGSVVPQVSGKTCQTHSRPPQQPRSCGVLEPQRLKHLWHLFLCLGKYNSQQRDDKIDTALGSLGVWGSTNC